MGLTTELDNVLKLFLLVAALATGCIDEMGHAQTAEEAEKRYTAETVDGPLVLSHVNAGVVSLPNVVEVNGSLVLSGSGINELHMSNLKAVTASVIIDDNTELVALGLEKLETVDRVVGIVGNPKLKEIAISSIEHIGYRAEIFDNRELPECSLELVKAAAENSNVNYTLTPNRGECACDGEGNVIECY